MTCIGCKINLYSVTLIWRQSFVTILDNINLVDAGQHSPGLVWKMDMAYVLLFVHTKAVAAACVIA